MKQILTGAGTFSAIPTMTGQQMKTMEHSLVPAPAGDEAKFLTGAGTFCYTYMTGATDEDDGTSGLYQLLPGD